MRTLVHNIACIFGIERQGRLRLCGEEMGRMETLENAWLLVEDGRIATFGSMTEDVPENVGRRVDAGGGMLFPSFCDSHTHLVYAGSREQEFLDKINGLSYAAASRSSWTRSTDSPTKKSHAVAEAYSTPPTGCMPLRKTNSTPRRWSACGRLPPWAPDAWKSRAATAFRPETS